MTHSTDITSFVAAGQRNHRPSCNTCPWVGPTTTDKQTANDAAATHRRGQG